MSGANGGTGGWFEGLLPFEGRLGRDYGDLGRETGASLIAQLVKNLSAMQETPVRFLGWEDPLEKGMATHSSILAWRIRVAKNWARLSDFHSLRFTIEEGLPWWLSW